VAKSTGETAQTPGTDVAAPEPGSKGVGQVIDYQTLLADSQEDLGFRKEDIAVPFIKVLQSLSPELKKQNPKYIDGAEEGDFINSVTGRVYKGGTGIILVPAAFLPSYIEWKPRDSGGGIVKDWGTDGSIVDRCTRNDKKKLITPDGNHLVQSGSYYVYIVNPEGTYDQAVFNLYGTQLKKSKNWNALISQLTVETPGGRIRAPFMYSTYKLITVPEQNDQGAWMGVKVSYHKPTAEVGGIDLYNMAKTFRELALSGAVKVTPQTQDDIPEGQAEPINDDIM
jgi:hypothetical protein